MMTREQLSDIEVATKTFAEILGLTSRRVQQLRAEGLPYTERNQIRLLAGLQWYLTQQQKPPIDLMEARQRRLSAQAQLAELELGQQQGHLINRQEIIEAIQKSLLQLRNRLLSIPTKLSPVLAVEANAALTKNILEDEIHKALTELSVMQFQPQTKKSR